MYKIGGICGECARRGPSPARTCGSAPCRRAFAALVLRQLPGVHAHNYRKLMNSVLNLQELASRSQEQLAAIIGAQNGRMLHDFLHREG